MDTKPPILDAKVTAAAASRLTTAHTSPAPPPLSYYFEETSPRDTKPSTLDPRITHVAASDLTMPDGSTAAAPSISPDLKLAKSKQSHPLSYYLTGEMPTPPKKSPTFSLVNEPLKLSEVAGTTDLHTFSSLNPSCTKTDIAKDPHSLFRATGFDLIQNLRSHPAHYAVICENLDTLLRNFSKLPPDTQKLIAGGNLAYHINVIKLLLDPSCTEDPLTIMNNKAFSDGLVQALRAVTSAYHLTDKGALRKLGFNRKDIKDIAVFNSHIQKMSEMKPDSPKGRGVEGDAISEIFGINFLSFSFNKDAGNTIEKYGEGPKKDSFTITTLSNKDHHDLLSGLDNTFIDPFLQESSKRIPLVFRTID